MKTILSGKSEFLRSLVIAGLSLEDNIKST
jgi:hypothetical protein